MCTVLTIVKLAAARITMTRFVVKMGVYMYGPIVPQVESTKLL